MCYVILHSWVKKNCYKKVVNYFKRQIPCNKIKIDSLSRGKVRKKKAGGRHEEWSSLNRMWMFPQVVRGSMGQRWTLGTCHMARRGEDKGQRECQWGAP